MSTGGICNECQRPESHCNCYPVGPIACSLDANVSDRAVGDVTGRSPDAPDAEGLVEVRLGILRIAIQTAIECLPDNEQTSDALNWLEGALAHDNRLSAQASKEETAPDNGLEGSERPANGMRLTCDE